MAKDLVMAQIRAGILAPDNVQDALQQTYASPMVLKAHEEADGCRDDSTSTTRLAEEHHQTHDYVPGMRAILQADVHQTSAGA
jgi:hypothetical protein